MTRAFTILGPDDAGAAAMIHAAAFNTPWPASELRVLLGQPATLAIGALADDALVGFICAQVVLDEADILTVAVSPEARRAGHARALLFALHRRLGERGIRRATLDVASDNLAALNLYQSVGYQQDGRRKAYYKRGTTPAVDAVLMSRNFGLCR